MVRSRVYRWRLLFALLLGVGAWWGVDWWLRPKPWFKATFPILMSKLAPDFVFMHKPFARIFDREGRYLYVESQLTDSLNRYQLVDLRSRQVVAEHVLDNTTIPKELSIDRMDFARLGYQSALLGNYSFVYANSLWEWNAIQNTYKKARAFPFGSNLRISEDGSTLLEVEQTTPLVPALLQPPSLTNILGGLAQEKVETSDLAIVRVWSLPEVHLRSTVSFPWLYRCDHFELSPDGRYLIIADESLPAGFESPVFATNANQNQSTSKRYWHCPTGIQILDNDNMSLWWEKSGYSGWYNQYQDSPNGSEAITFTGGQYDRTVYSPGSDTFSLMLRTRRVIPSLSVLSGSRGTPDIIYLTLEHSTKNQQQNRYGLYEVNLKLDEEPILRHSSSEVLYAIAPGPQTLSLRVCTYSEYLPGWFVRLLSKSKTVADWLEKGREDSVVYDHHDQRVLWQERYDRDAEPGGKVDENWFCTHKADLSQNQMQIEVYRLPFPSWSPWLARLSGIFIAVLAWWVIGRFARTRVKAV